MQIITQGVNNWYLIHITIFTTYFTFYTLIFIFNFFSFLFISFIAKNFYSHVSLIFSSFFFISLISTKHNLNLSQKVLLYQIKKTMPKSIILTIFLTFYDELCIYTHIHKRMQALVIVSICCPSLWNVNWSLLHSIRSWVIVHICWPWFD